MLCSKAWSRHRCRVHVVWAEEVRGAQARNPIAQASAHERRKTDFNSRMVKINSKDLSLNELSVIGNADADAAIGLDFLGRLWVQIKPIQRSATFDGHAVGIHA